MNMKTRDRRTRGDVLFDNLNVIAMLLICFATLYPVWYVLVNSFNDGTDAMTGGQIYWVPGCSAWKTTRRSFRTPAS